MAFALFWNLFNVGFLGRVAQWSMIVEIVVILGIVLIVFMTRPNIVSAFRPLAEPPNLPSQF